MITLLAKIAKDPIGTFEGLGPLGTFKKGEEFLDSFAKFTNVFSTGIGVLTISAGIWFIIQIFAGSFQWLASGGEKQALQNAQKRLTNAVVGLFVVVFSYALIAIVGLIFGINILSPLKSLVGYTSLDGASPYEPDQILRVPSGSRDAVPQ